MSIGGSSSIASPGRSSRLTTILLATALLAAANAAHAASVVGVAAGGSHSCAITAGGGAVCWGDNTYGQLGDGTTASRSAPVAVASLLAGVVSVVTGGSHSCALTAAGGVKCWGYNYAGQLGDGTTTSRTSPVDVSGLTSGVSAIAAGLSFNCALTSSGGVKCWGANGSSQLGNGSTTDSATPVDVTGLTTGVSVITSGGTHACAVTSNGGLACWGYNSRGQLGNGTTTTSPTPVPVTGLTSGVLAATAGQQHTCALSATGGIKCWGDNAFGQLGDGTTTYKTTPANVSGLTGGAAGVWTSRYHTCAVTTDGRAQCWGRNFGGALGDGTTTDRSSPTDVSGLSSGAAVLVPGLNHTCALMADGGAKCWGLNTYGRVGDGTTTDRPTPVNVSGLVPGEAPLPFGADSVSRGRFHACAVTRSGGVQCWGFNDWGVVGDGTTITRHEPVWVAGLTSGVASVTAGAHHTCAVTVGGGVKCWGSSPFGEVGDGTTTTRLTPVAVSGLASEVVSVAAGYNHTCAVTTSGGLLCWGYNGWGQLGDGTTTNVAWPVGASGLSSGVAQVSAGTYHTCIVTTAGGAKCFGQNDRGQLGDNSTTTRLTSTWVNGLTSGVSAIAVGGSASCAVLATGALRCWGGNEVGQLGDGTTTDRWSPVAVSAQLSGIAAVRVGDDHACDLTTSGSVRCWGGNSSGQIGDGTTSQRLTPVAVNALAVGARSISTGNMGTCAITLSGGLQCWGNNSVGEIGDGTTTQRATPAWTKGLLGGVAAVGTGASHSCRITAAGGVQCWGAGTTGELGSATTTMSNTPVDVTGLTSGVVALAVGSYHSCALTSAGAVKCWGYNLAGNLGDGTTTTRMTPVDVVGLTGGVMALTAGERHTCALTVSGGVKCWGDNQYGQLGDATTTARYTPVWVAELTSGVRSISAGVRFTCAVTTGGAARCWGQNDFGQIGDGTGSDRSTPGRVTGLSSGVEQVFAGGYHACALTSGGGVTCWGANVAGELGDGTTTNRSTPVEVVGLTSNVASVALGRISSCAVTTTGGVKCWGDNSYGQVGDGTLTDRSTPTNVSGLSSGVGALDVSDQACAITATGRTTCWGSNLNGQIGDGTRVNRTKPTSVRGHKLWHDFDGDVKADLAVYRPATGTWFSMDSANDNASYRSIGWGIQAEGDTPVVGDFDGDGLVDPAVYRPGTGTWFILESHANFTTWSWFGWGNATDTPVPGDYDGDGKTDGAIYRASEGRWYVRPSSGAPGWNRVFGQAGDIPVAGDYDGDDKTDPAVYRPSTGSWFVLTSSSNYTSYWTVGWGIDASGDTPVPGDYDGDGRTDPCVYRPGPGTWFVLESHANFTTWNWFGWGTATDIPVPSDFDGDGKTDGAIYRPSTGGWHVLPSGGRPGWFIPFGQAGDVPLLKVR